MLDARLRFFSSYLVVNLTRTQADELIDLVAVVGNYVFDLYLSDGRFFGYVNRDRAALFADINVAEIALLK